jgi:hypothetical protein
MLIHLSHRLVILAGRHAHLPHFPHILKFEDAHRFHCEFGLMRNPR